MFRVFFAVFVLMTEMACLAFSEDPAKAPSGLQEASAPGSNQLSDAEQIIQLQKALEAERKELQKTEKELASPPESFRKALADYKAIDAEVARKKALLERVKKDQKAEEVARLEKELPELEKSLEEAKKRYALNILEQKILQDKVETLKEKIRTDQAMLDQLMGKGKPGDPTPDGGEKSPTKDSPPGTEPGLSEKDKPSKDNSASPGEKPLADKGTDKELKEAKRDAQQKDEEAREAEEKASSVLARLQNLKKSIETEQRIIQASTLKVEQAQKAIEELDRDIQAKVAANAPQAEITAKQKELSEERKRLREAETDLQQSRARIAQLLAKMTTLQLEQSIALQEAEKKREEAEKARKTVAFLENPFHPRNILQWLIDHGLRLFLILLGMIVLYWILIASSRRFFAVINRRTRYRENVEEDTRTETLRATFRQLVKVILLTIAVLMVLDEVGVSISTLLGGVAVAGLAFSFAAQCLIKDYFIGFMILMEDQYSVGDIVEIGSVTGSVERVSMRVTVVRGLDGNLHFIPNGSMTVVTNLSHGWSRAMFDIGVAYREDPDRVMAVLMELAGEMRQDETFKPMILDDPQMLGVDTFADSSIVIKFFIKTKPTKQWEVRRELLRRIKKRFDELGIEIPFPHRTIFYRSDNGDSASHSQTELAEQNA